MLSSFFIKRRRNVVIQVGLNNQAKTERLSKEELSELNRVWGRIMPITQKNSRFYELLKQYGDGRVNPYYCAEDIFNSYVVRALNLPVNVIGFEHKGLYKAVFRDVNQPEIIVNCINGNYFNSNLEPITEEEANKHLNDYDGDKFCKVSVFSNQGKGCQYIEKGGKVTVRRLSESFKGDNFIVQKVVKQSKLTSVFSKKSLNTFRLSTLFINGKCSLGTIMFRCGVGDNVIDNGIAGNIFIGVSPDGTFEEYGYDKWMNFHYQSDTGIKFKGVKIDLVKCLVDFVKITHVRYLPQCGFVGWDVAIDENDKPLLIEVNLFSPGIYIEQLSAHKPIFGDRTEEVIDFVVNHRPNLLSSFISLGY